MLTPLQEQVAGIIAGLAEAEGFALVGGAALIARGDVQRQTSDLDFFGLTPAAVDLLVPAVDRALREEGLVVRHVQENPGFARLIVESGDDRTECSPRWPAASRGFALTSSASTRLRGRRGDPGRTQARPRPPRGGAQGPSLPQLGKLRAACAFPYLLVEGTDIDRGPLHHNAVRGACLAVIDQGIALLRSGYQRDSALWIHRLAVRCQQVEPAAERPAYAQRPRPKPGDETAEALLAAVPGISTTSARALLERFGSVAAVVAADPVEWLTVPGIGPERARALAETFTLRRGSLTIAHDR